MKINKNLLIAAFKAENKKQTEKIEEQRSIIKSLKVSLAEKERIVNKVIDELLVLKGGRS